MNTLLTILFWVFVYMVWKDAQTPKKEIPEERIKEQEALVAKLEDRALGKHPSAHVHTVAAKELKALNRMYEMNLKWREMQLKEKK